MDNCLATDEWTHTHTHTHNGILLGHKKEWNISIKKNEIFATTQMDPDVINIMLSEISHTGKDEYSVITYMWNLKNKTMIW